MKWRKAITIEEAALQVMGFNPDKYIINLKEELSNGSQIENCLIEKIDKADREANIYEKWLEETTEIFCALLEDLNILTELPDYQRHSPSVTLVIHNSIQNRSPETPLLKLKVTKESLANWFYEAGDLEKARRLMPSYKPYNQSDINIELENLQQENTRLKKTIEELTVQLKEAKINHLPSGIKYAIDVFENCWHHLEDDLKRPAKDNLIGYIKTRLKQTEGTLIESIIKLSIPDNERLGGKPKKNQVYNWKPKINQ